jgi:hypothetical protein
MSSGSKESDDYFSHCSLAYADAGGVYSGCPPFLGFGVGAK